MGIAAISQKLERRASVNGDEGKPADQTGQILQYRIQASRLHMLEHIDTTNKRCWDRRTSFGESGIVRVIRIKDYTTTLQGFSQPLLAGSVVGNLLDTI